MLPNLKRLTLVWAVAITLQPAPGAAEKPSQIGNLVIERPWARASIGTKRPAAAYATIRNIGIDSDTLIGVRSPSSGRADIHRIVTKGKVTRMLPAGPLNLPAGSTITLAPGGLHIMMMKLTSPLIRGKTVDITFKFRRAGEVTVTAPVLGPGAAQPK